jgi:hypothetical protein
MALRTREYVTEAFQAFLARVSDSVREVADIFFAQTEAVLMEENYESIENAWQELGRRECNRSSFSGA